MGNLHIHWKRYKVAQKPADKNAGFSTNQVGGAQVGVDRRGAVQGWFYANFQDKGTIQAAHKSFSKIFQLTHRKWKDGFTSRLSSRDPNVNTKGHKK